MPIQLGRRRAFEARFTDIQGNECSIDESQQEIAAATTNGAIEDFAKVFGTGLNDGKVVGCSGKVRPSALGPVQVQVTADADRGDGVRTLTLIGEETVIQGEASGGTITFGGDDEN